MAPVSRPPADPSVTALGRDRAAFVPGLRIGLLGGSFNPAHDGHRHISLVALRRLGLDRVVWMVSPQNPLKPSAGLADMADRIRRARMVARHPRLFVTDIEARLSTRFTADTLRALRQRFPAIAFVWLMGADNLVQLPRWQNWDLIARTMPIAVIDRPGYGLKAQMGKAAQRFAASRISGEGAAALPIAEPPAWVYLHAKLNPRSASGIRHALPEGTSWTSVPLDRQGNPLILENPDHNPSESGT